MASAKRRSSEWLGSLALAIACVPQTTATKRCNVLIVTLDTTRADRLGCYGYARAHTANLDRLAAEGVRFDLAISTNGLTPMAHASLMTGVNPYRHDLRVFFGDAGHQIDANVPTLAQTLAQAGYATGAALSAYPVSEAYGFDRGFQSFDTGIDLAAIDLSHHMEHEKFWVDATASKNQRRSDATTDRALQWLAGRAHEQPWFLWTHFFDAHDFSLVPPADFCAALGADWRKLPKFDNLAARYDWIYDADLAWIDRQLGRLFAEIERRGDAANTLIVVIGDHGQGLKDGFERHGWFLHTLLYQWCIRVPLIVKLPDAVGIEAPRGKVVAELVRSIDVVPTVLEVAGLKPPASKIELEGESLLPLIYGDESSSRIAYADALTTIDHHAGQVPEPQHDDLFCAMNRRWKLIWHRHQPEKSELFDLADDPLERKNVLAQHADVVAELKGWLDKRGAFEVRPPGASEQDPKQKALLDALGYGKDKKEDE